VHDGVSLEGSGKIVVSKIEVILLIKSPNALEDGSFGKKAPSYEFDWHPIANMVLFLPELVEREIGRVPIQRAKRQDMWVQSLHLENL
jgi:hypothetical protein